MMRAAIPDALAAAREIAAGRTTAVALVERCLAHIGEREEDVRAWKHLDADGALAAARALDAEAPRSPLHGVPVGVKDVLDTADMPTGYGSQIHEGARPAMDAACVALLRSAGMVVLGKTVTTEFAMRKAGATRNPNDLTRTPGGSSSGSAAAVGAGMVPLAIGTQTAGSVIRPASYCGVVGWKPTYGAVPRRGLAMISESLDTIGTMAGNVADAGAFSALMGARPLPEMAQLDTAPRLGICRSPAWKDIQPDGAAEFETAGEIMWRAGATVRECEPGGPFDDAAAAHEIIMPFEAARLLAWERARHNDMLSEVLRGTLDEGGALPLERWEWAKGVQRALPAAFDAALGDLDAVITPAAPGEAPVGLDFTGLPVFNRIWTLAGLPCVTLPGLMGPNGMPIGLQVVGRYGEDARTLAVADWVHRQLTTG